MLVYSHIWDALLKLVTFVAIIVAEDYQLSRKAIKLLRLIMALIRCAAGAVWIIRIAFVVEL